MGATAALLYLSNKEAQKNVLAAIYDSPYSDLEELINIQSKKRTSLPGFLVDIFID